MSGESLEQSNTDQIMALTLPSWIPSLPNTFALPSLGDIESRLDMLGGTVESSISQLRQALGNGGLLPSAVGLVQHPSPQDDSTTLSQSQELPNKQEPLSSQATEAPSGASLIDQALPKELMLFLFSYLDVKSLSHRACLVSKAWFQLANEEMLWKDRYWKDVSTWDSVHAARPTTSNKSWGALYTNTQKVLYGKLFNGVSLQTTEPSWKRKFMAQYNYNCEDYKNHVKLRTAPVSNLQRKVEPYAGGLGFRSPFGGKTYKIVIVGEGLETSAKCLVYEMMWGANTPFKMTKLYPGNGGIGSGVGFELNGVDLNITAIYNHSQMLQRGAQQQWIDLFKDTHAVMFVMDVYGDTTTVKQELDALLDTQNGLSSTAPVIVLACKHHTNKRVVQADADQSNAGAATDASSDASLETDDPLTTSGFTAMTSFDIAEKLELNKLSRWWCVRKVDVETLDGVYQSLDWLLSVM